MYTAKIKTQFLTEKMVSLLSHPPYLFELSLSDYFLFPKLKINLKRDRFASIEEIQETVTRKQFYFKEQFFKNLVGVYNVIETFLNKKYYKKIFEFFLSIL